MPDQPLAMTETGAAPINEATAQTQPDATEMRPAPAPSPSLILSGKNTVRRYMLTRDVRPMIGP
jgi:hypothetical protein